MLKLYFVNIFWEHSFN